MLRLSICFSLIITLGLALTACGGGGSTTVPTTPVTNVNLNGTTFNLASCHDFSTTPVGPAFSQNLNGVPSHSPGLRVPR